MVGVCRGGVQTMPDGCPAALNKYACEVLIMLSSLRNNCGMWQEAGHRLQNPQG